MALLSSRGTVGDEVFGLIKQVGLKPRIINAFFPWGGGFNIFFGQEDPVVKAWQKSGEASDEVIARLMEEMTIVKNENKELSDENKGLKDQLESFEARLEVVTKGKHEAVYDLDQMRDELANRIRDSKEVENHYLSEQHSLNRDIIQFKEKITIITDELLSVQEEKSNQEQKHAILRQKQEQCLQSSNDKLKRSKEKSELVSLELNKAQESLLLNEDVIEGIKAASESLKEESDEKIRVMETALDEAKLNNQLSNNASALKSNEVENSKMTQTEPRYSDEYLEEVLERGYDTHIEVWWEEFLDMCLEWHNDDDVYIVVRECANSDVFLRDGEYNIYIRKKSDENVVPLKKAL